MPHGTYNELHMYVFKYTIYEYLLRILNAYNSMWQSQSPKTKRNYDCDTKSGHNLRFMVSIFGVWGLGFRV